MENLLNQITLLEQQIKGDFSPEDMELFKQIKELKNKITELEVQKPDGSSFECFGCGS